MQEAELDISDMPNVVRLGYIGDKRNNTHFINKGTEVFTKEVRSEVHETLDGYRRSLAAKLCQNLNRNDIADADIIFVWSKNDKNGNERPAEAFKHDERKYQGKEQSGMKWYFEASDEYALEFLRTSTKSGTAKKKEKEERLQCSNTDHSQPWPEKYQENELNNVGPILNGMNIEEVDNFSLELGSFDADFPLDLTGPLAQNDAQALSMHDELWDKIEELQTLKQCRHIYRSASYQECIKLLRSSQRQYKEYLHCRDAWQGTTDAQERFAEHWARELSLDKDWAWALNRCRKTALALLYKVCDLSYLKDGSSPTDTFRPENIYQILIHCLVMDRANSLYNMNGGQGWYAKADEPEYLYRQLLPRNPEGRASINKRLRKLYEDTSLNMKQDEHYKSIHKWMQWKGPVDPENEKKEQIVRQLLEELRAKHQNEEKVQEYLFLKLFEGLEVGEAQQEVGVGSKRLRTNQG